MSDNTNIFGYLPKEVLNNIGYLFLLPEIDILRIYSCQNYQDLYFQVNFQYTTVKLKTLHDQFRNEEQKASLNKFITDVTNNIDCFYNEEYHDERGFYHDFFRISVRDNKIAISNIKSEIILPMECRGKLLLALRKYYSLLDLQLKY